MIIFGARSRHIASKEIPATCSSCREKKMLFHVHGSYAHVMWIPCIPFGKKVSSRCRHCQNYLTLKEMPQDLRLKAREFRSATSYPKWFYSGIGIITVLITYFLVNNQLNKSQLSGYIKNPKVGDVYYIEETAQIFPVLKLIV